MFQIQPRLVIFPQESHTNSSAHRVMEDLAEMDGNRTLDLFEVEEKANAFEDSCQCGHRERDRAS